MKNKKEKEIAVYNFLQIFTASIRKIFILTTTCANQSL